MNQTTRQYFMDNIQRLRDMINGTPTGVRHREARLVQVIEEGWVRVDREGRLVCVAGDGSGGMKAIHKGWAGVRAGMSGDGDLFAAAAKSDSCGSTATEAVGASTVASSSSLSSFPGPSQRDDGFERAEVFPHGGPRTVDVPVAMPQPASVVGENSGALVSETKPQPPEADQKAPFGILYPRPKKGAARIGICVPVGWPDNPKNVSEGQRQATETLVLSSPAKVFADGMTETALTPTQPTSARKQSGRPSVLVKGEPRESFGPPATQDLPHDHDPNLDNKREGTAQPAEAQPQPGWTSADSRLKENINKAKTTQRQDGLTPQYPPSQDTGGCSTGARDVQTCHVFGTTPFNVPEPKPSPQKPAATSPDPKHPRYHERPVQQRYLHEYEPRTTFWESQGKRLGRMVSAVSGTGKGAAGDQPAEHQDADEPLNSRDIVVRGFAVRMEKIEEPQECQRKQTTKQESDASVGPW
ncbi:hypothetical protein VTI74DRAFT_4283 [Chaetomium olivicolor]